MSWSALGSRAALDALARGDALDQPPFIIGFILGPMAETNFRRAMQLSSGDATSFLTNPISGTFLTLAALSIADEC